MADVQASASDKAAIAHIVRTTASTLLKYFPILSDNQQAEKPRYETEQKYPYQDSPDAPYGETSSLHGAVHSPRKRVLIGKETNCGTYYAGNNYNLNHNSYCFKPRP